MRSVEKIWKFVSKYPGPAFLMGDFNNEPHSKPLRFLGGVDSIGKQRTTFKDTWLLLHPEPRAGVDSYDEDEPRDPGLTFSTDNLRKRIDIIYLRDDDDTLRVKNIRTVGEKIAGCAMASDHLGLVAEVEVARPWFEDPHPSCTA